MAAALSWSCRKQDLVSLSSTEVEYVTFSEAGKEVIWLKRLFKDFEVIEIDMHSLIYTDSRISMKMIIDQKFSNRTKHIDIRYHHVKDLANEKEIQLQYSSSGDKVTDMMTKPLGSIKIRQSTEKTYLEGSSMPQC